MKTVVQWRAPSPDKEVSKKRLNLLKAVVSMCVSQLEARLLLTLTVLRGIVYTRCVIGRGDIW
jgi:hypothetical protein